MNLYYFCLGFFLNVTFTTCEIYTSLVDLSNSFASTNQLRNELNIFEDIIRHNTNSIRSFVTKLDTISLHDLYSESFDLLKTYVLVKELVYRLEELPELVTNNNIDNLMNKVQLTCLNLPDKYDMLGSADALLRLQFTYQIPTQKIANGNLYNNRFSHSLSASECFEIGLRSSEKDYFHLIQWMNEAYNRFSYNDNYIEKTQILDHLSYGHYKQGNYRQALAFTNEWIKIDPKNERALGNKDYFENELAKSKNSNLLSKGDYEDFNNGDEGINVRPRANTREKEFFTYEALCRGESTILDRNNHLLKCRFYVPHYYFMILPIKEETIYYNPRIVIYHDVISEAEIDEIKELSIPRLNRATVQNSITGKLEYANYRISKSAWLRYDLARITKRINDKIAIMTGIDLMTSEELQVVNYGVGGHYEPHFDFARKQEINSFEPEVGNRIATLIYYMSDVDAGGATVFTKIGAKILPKKGSAAFWWNLLPSGDGDLSTRHAACPVLGGSKWVMNKWFHERGQELIRPCCLNRFSQKYHFKCF